MKMRHEVFAGYEGDRLAVDVFEGGERTVLFLHGGGQTRRAWDGTARMVAQRGMRAVTLDLRGHGESDWSKSGHYRFSDYAADVAAVVSVLAERDGAKPAVVGASLGGIAALTAETTDGPLISGLVLVDVILRMNPSGIQRIQGFMAERMVEGFATLDEAAAAIALYLPNRKRPPSTEGLRKNLRLDADGRYRWHWDPAMIGGPNAINSNARDVLLRVETLLPKLAIPVLLVRGMDSEVVDEDGARDFIGRIPNGRYVDVGGAGHMVAGDRNDAFCDAILEFLGETADA